MAELSGALWSMSGACGLWSRAKSALVRGSSPVWHTHHEVAEDLDPAAEEAGRVELRGYRFGVQVRMAVQVRIAAQVGLAVSLARSVGHAGAT